MACPAIITGDRFLLRVLDHIDCQAQTLGSFGFQALASPGSPAESALTGLLTLFIALFAVRLLFGPGLSPRDVVGDVLKVGTVLTLALSWPAYRTLVYSLVIDAPAEIATTISDPELARPGTGLAQRLQAVDSGILAITASGAGRNTGGLLEGDTRNGGFRAIALNDENSFGYARMAYLAGTIAPLLVIRLGAGLLLALAPLAAGLLLFEASRGLFAGWMRGLVLTILGALGLTIVLSVELAVLEPWLADALRLRGLGYAVPSAPTELLALTVAFPLATFGLLLLLARVSFQRGWPTMLQSRGSLLPVRSGQQSSAMGGRTLHGEPAIPTRAFLVAESVRSTLRHEEQRASGRAVMAPFTLSHPGEADLAAKGRTAPVGSGARRTSRRASGAGKRRDAPS